MTLWPVFASPPAKRGAAFVCAALSLCTPPVAQESNRPPVLSPSCGVPMSKLALPAPLPVALKDKDNHSYSRDWILVHVRDRSIDARQDLSIPTSGYPREDVQG